MNNRKSHEQLAPANPLARKHPLCELRETGCVVEESTDYSNRGASRFVRRYVTVKL